MSEECFFQSDDLEEALSLYKEENRGKIKKLSDFLDNIQTNRKYYRTGIQKNKKYKKEVTEDTNIIKTINSLINRTTNAFGNFRDAIGGGITSILDNTIMGKLMAGFDATNPRAFNYNPALQGQIDFMRSPDAAKLGISYGTNPNTGLNQIIGGELKGKNLQSMFGSNDLMAMYDKELARAQGVLENLPNQWSKLAASTDEADIARWKEKQLFHRNKVARIKE